MDRIIDALRRFDQLGDWSHTAVALSAGLIAALLTAIAARVAVAVAERVTGRTSTVRDDQLLGRVRRPLGLFAPVVGIHAAAAWVGLPWIVGVAQLVEGLLFTYILVSAFEILVVESWLESRQGIRVPGPVRQLIITVIYGAVLLGIAGDAFGFDVTPLLATGSVTTVVLGLALQGPLSNLFAGIVLHVENHPRPGEWVLIDGREGEIQEIGWRTTRMRTFTDDVVAVPNAVLLNAQVVNFTSPTTLHGRTIPVPVPLDLPPHLFDRWVRDCLKPVPHIVDADEPRTKTWLVAIDDHCQRYQVRFWVDHFRFHDDAESEFLKRLWYRFAEEGVAFPTPFQAVRVVEDPAGPMAGLAPKRPPGGFPPSTG